MYQSSNKKELLSLAPENGFQKFKYSFHHWQQERLQNLSSWWIPRIAAHSKYPIYHFAHTKSANAALSMHKWCLKQLWKLTLSGWVAERSWGISHSSCTDGSSKNDTATECKVVSHRLQLARTGFKKQTCYPGFFNYI